MKMEVEEWVHVSYYGQVPLIGRRHSSLGILLPSSSLDLAGIKFWWGSLCCMIEQDTLTSRYSHSAFLPRLRMELAKFCNDGRGMG